MKKVTLLGAALLSLAACTDTTDYVVPVQGNTILTATASAPSAGDTRTAVDPTDYLSGQIGIHWMPGDRIGVFGDKGTANAPFTNRVASRNGYGEFVGNLQSGEQALYAYYPYSDAAGSDVTSLKGTIPVEQHYNTATGEIEGDYKWGTPSDVDNLHFGFDHLFAFLRFEVDAAGSTVENETLKSISLTIAGTNLAGDFTFDATKGTHTMTEAQNETVTMLWDDQPVMDRSFRGYMSVAPVQIEGKELVVEIATNNHKVKFFGIRPKISAIEKNTYYTLPLSLKIMEDDKNITTEISEPDREPAAWVPALESQLACANWVFALPGQRMMHKIRVADKNRTVTAYGLPEGLTWNKQRSLVEGTVAAPGEYTYSVEVCNADGTVAFTEGVKLTVSNDLLEPTPHMGWQSWNVLEKSVDEASVKGIADALVSNGYAALGYKWLGIDDCWQQNQNQNDDAFDSNGYPKVNTSKFPNGLKAVTDYIHSKGLKAGIYSDAGPITCEGWTGAHGREAKTAEAFTVWGFDKLKEDWFWHQNDNPVRDLNGTLDPASTTLAYDLYKRMGDGIKSNGNKILLSMCEWGIHEPWRWGPEVGATSWRMSYDHRDGWMGTNGKIWPNNKENTNSENSIGLGIGLCNTLHLMRDLWPYAGVNRHNDPDMLVVAIRGTGSSSSDLVAKGGMSDAEYETEFAMWCMWSAPLLITADIRSSSLNAHDVALLKNEELIAINQDALSQQAEFIKEENGVWYFMKDLANGDVAIAAVNMQDFDKTYSIKVGDYNALDTGAAYASRDLLLKKDAASLTASAPLGGTLAKHATKVYRLKKN